MRKLLLPLILFYLFNCCKDGDIIIEQSEEKIITVKVRDTIFIVDDSYEVIELNPIPLKKDLYVRKNSLVFSGYNLLLRTFY